MTQQPRTFSSATVDSAAVSLLERTLFQIDDVMEVARLDGHEEVACFPVRSDHVEFWVTDFLAPAKAYIRERLSITGAECPDGYGMIHWHPFPEDAAPGKLCEPSPDDLNPKAANVPVFLLACGKGMDSLVAYRVRKR